MTQQEKLTDEEFLAHVRYLVQEEGSEEKFCLKHNLSKYVLADILSGVIRIPVWLAKALGYKRIAVYVKAEE